MTNAKENTINFIKDSDGFLCLNEIHRLTRPINQSFMYELKFKNDLDY